MHARKVAQCHDADAPSWFPRSRRRSLGYQKIFVVLAHEVLEGLLIRMRIEINDGPLAKALNMALLPVLKKYDHM